jgi:hypothetical protein
MGYYELKGSKIQTSSTGAWCYYHEMKLKLPSKQDVSATQERVSNAGEEAKAL